jgi:hypothetical protein
MRDKLGVLIGQVSNFPLSKGWAAFLTGVLYSSSHTPNSISLQVDFNETNRFSCFLGLLGREHSLEAWKLNSKASLSNTSESQFLQMIDLALLVPFKSTIVRSRLASIVLN